MKYFSALLIIAVSTLAMANTCLALSFLIDKNHNELSRITENSFDSYPVDGWLPQGWIPKEATNYKILIAHSLRIDNGEKRIAVERRDGSGVNLWMKEL